MRFLTFPLICDQCSNPINHSTEAMVEWFEDDASISNVRVVHNIKYSPTGNCFIKPFNYFRKDFELDSILKDSALQNKLGIKHM